MIENYSLSNANFYFETEVLQWLYQRYQDNDQGKLPITGDDFSYDVIDQPFHVAIKIESDEVVYGCAIYRRSELGVNDESTPDLSLVMRDGEDKPEIKSSGRIGNLDGDLFFKLYKAGAEIKEYIFSHNLEGEFADLDLKKEGVLVTLKDDELSFERVSGKERPDLACTSLFNGITMSRPYFDEISESWAHELVPFSVKLEAAENGDIEAMTEVANAYLDGDFLNHVDPDPKKAVYWFRKLAEAGDSTGMFDLGILCFKGEGTEQSFEESLYWMKKAEENGDTDAPAFVKVVEEFVDLEKRSGNGDTVAMADLAERYMKVAGQFDEELEDKFYCKSISLAEKAALDNEPKAMWVLGLAYEHGRGVQVDEEKANEYYQKGTDLGHSGCMLNLGADYIEGEGVDQDMTKGFELCLKSANLGYAPAMKTVGACYQFGHGVEDNMKSAIEWYEKYLELEDDAELAQKVMIFKTLVDDDEMVEV